MTKNVDISMIADGLKGAIHSALQEAGGDLTPQVAHGVQRMAEMVAGAYLELDSLTGPHDEVLLTRHVFRVGTKKLPDLRQWVNSLPTNMRSWWDANLGTSSDSAFVDDEAVHRLVQGAIEGLEQYSLLRTIGLKADARALFPPCFFTR